MPAITTQTNGDVLVVYFNDKQILDQIKIQELSTALMAVIAKVPSGKLLLDFSAVEFMSDSMLGRLVELRNRCKEERIEIKLCRIAPEIMELFKITRLGRLFEIYDDEHAAISAFAKRGWFE